MNKEEKRGLSPVVATVLLVSLALVLAIIIFLWARAFLPEAIEKGGSDIDYSCEAVNFKAEAFTSEQKIWIENIGDIPIWGIEIRKKRFLGDIVQPEEFGENQINIGESISVDISSLVGSGEIVSGDTIIITPILLGETETKHKSYICDIEYGLEIIVDENLPGP